MQQALPRQFLRRIAAFLIGMLVLFLLAVAGLGVVENRTRRAILEDETQEQARVFDAALLRLGEPLRMFTEAYARRTSFTRPGATLDALEPPAVLRAGTRIFEAHSAWVIEADDALRFAVATGTEAPIPLPRLPPAATRTDPLRFHFVRDGDLWEVSGRRLNRNRREPEQAPGWILAARRLGIEALNRPALPLDGEVTILPVNAPPAPPALARISIDRVLPGFDGQPVSRLRFSYDSHELESVGAGRRRSTLVMIGFAAIPVLFMGLALWRWVIHPATAMHRSLAADDPAPLAPLAAAGGDYARLAETLRALLEDRAALRRALAGRAQLDRDLHDGVIQSLFASGLSLTQARKLMRADPATAERAVDDVQDTLNHTIREVRAMIDEPASAADASRNFAETAAAVVSQACAGDPGLVATVEIDEAAAAARPLAHRVELLHFVREAASNVLRHARASALTVTLRAGPRGAACLEIDDDGAGFEPARASPGRGLRNLTERAAVLGATLAIDSAPGRGTRLRLELPAFAANPGPGE